MGPLLSAVKNLNLAVHLNGVDVQTPPSASAFFGFLFTMVTFDFLPVDVIYDEFTGVEAEEASEVLGSIGYDSVSTIRNLGSVIVGLCIIPLGILFLKLKLIYTERYGPCCKKLKEHKCCKGEKHIDDEEVKNKCQVLVDRLKAKLAKGYAEWVDGFNLISLISFIDANYMFFCISSCIYYLYGESNFALKNFKMSNFLDFGVALVTTFCVLAVPVFIIRVSYLMGTISLNEE
jgi:hypothetical protein